ncbi:hypothetical protein B566_EDAN001931, partial [Ephemera danica]
MVNKLFSKEREIRTCFNCGGSTYHEVTTQVITHPDMLCIQLGRYNNSYEKTLEKITIPEKISITTNGIQMEYSLHGTISHHGQSADSGHYTCEIISQGTPKQCYKYDDEEVSTSYSMNEEESTLIFYNVCRLKNSDLHYELQGADEKECLPQEMNLGAGHLLAASLNTLAKPNTLADVGCSEDADSVLTP